MVISSLHVGIQPLKGKHSIVPNVCAVCTPNGFKCMHMRLLTKIDTVLGWYLPSIVPSPVCLHFHAQ